MAVESETYRITLGELREKGSREFPGREVLKPRHVCFLTGESRMTIQRKRVKYGFVDGETTYPKLARAMSKEA